MGKDKNDAEGALTNPSLADRHLSRIRGEGLPVGRCVDSVLIMRLKKSSYCVVGGCRVRGAYYAVSLTFSREFPYFSDLAVQEQLDTA